MNLRKRTTNVIDFMLKDIPPVAVDREDYRQRCINILLRNFQHVHRGVVDDVLRMLRDERTKSLSQLNGTMTLFVDTIIRKVRQM